MSSSLFINSFSPGDGEDDCWVFDVDVTDSGCFCVLVDISMGSETVSRFWVKLCNRLHSSFSSFSMEIACSLRENFAHCLKELVPVVEIEEFDFHQYLVPIILFHFGWLLGILPKFGYRLEICSFSDWDAWFLSFRLSSRLKSILEGVFLLLGGGLEASNQLVFDASPS
ncbi:hypothetical protein Tco_1302238 [Tanacetum coccineum]